MAISTHPSTADIPPHSRPQRRVHPALVGPLLSGLLLVGAFPHLDWGWLAWVALVPFFLTLSSKNFRVAICQGILLGMAFFGGLFYWAGVFADHAVGPVLASVVWVGMAAIQTASLALFAGLASGLRRLPSVWAWRLGVPALWVLLEWVRQLGILGMGWGDLAYTQHLALPILQLTKLTGVWGLSFLIILVNVAVAEAISGRKLTRWTAAVGMAFLAALAFGAATLHTEHLRPTFQAAALQGDIDQNVHQDPAYVQRVLRTFTEQGRAAAARGAVLTVWPETACPGYLRYDALLLGAVSAEAVENRQTVFVGGVDLATDGVRPTNTLFCVGPDGHISGTYSKQHLVPFGEYVPFRKQMPWLERLHLSIYDMAPGAAAQPLLRTAVGRVGAAICYDSTYGPLMRDETARGANLLVVSTDDTWFGWTAAARQHAAMAAVRAAEDDRYLVRSAATGISQIIAPTGQVLREAGLFRRAVVVAPVESRQTQTLYSRWGDWFVGACALMLIGLVALNARAAGTSRSSGR